MSVFNYRVVRPFCRRPRTVLLGAGGFVLACLGAFEVGTLFLDRADPQIAGLVDSGGAASTDAATETRIKAFCGDCHAVPQPGSFPRDMWHEEVEQGYYFYGLSGRTDLDPPAMGQTVAYFRSLAPERLIYPVSPEAGTPFRASFLQEKLMDESATAPPALACLCWTPLRTGAAPVLLASDMLSGQVAAWDPRDPRRPHRLAHLNHPCHIEPCDLDGDGTTGLLVADLGSYQAVDHDHGRVVWLRQEPRTGAFEQVVLASGLGRVTDARPIDTLGTGRPDVVVAEFGFHRTGKILLLKNRAPRNKPPRFEPEELDPRTGTVYVPVCDVDGDGRPDFLALVSNEHECVEAFLNQGNGKFCRHNLFRAPDLTYGSNGIQWIDLNGDGKPDILYTNGDAFDNDYLSPWHGVQWLENLGNLRFKFHRLTEMPGDCVAMAGDFDGDGDLDIVVVSCLPTKIRPETLDIKEIPSVVLLEQVSPGQFVRHTLERGLPCHAALAVGDFDADGRLDFAVGNHVMGAGAESQGRASATVWWNRGKPSQP